MPKKYSDASKEVRQQRIYDILKHCSDDSSMSVSEIHHRLIAEGIKTCTKTIQRDLTEDMPTTHRIMATETKPNRFYSDSDYKPDYLLTFSEWELQTMILALEGFKEMSSPHLKTLSQKTEIILLSKLPKSVAEEFLKLKAMTVVTPSFRGEAEVENSEAYRSVMRALKEGRAIQCRNNSPYKDESFSKIVRTFSPLFMHVSGSEHYLMAFDHDDQVPKRLKICRLIEVRVLAEKIDPALLLKHKNLKNTIGGFGGFDDSVVKYSITCDKVMATLFQERMIHSSQKVIADGESYQITFESNPSREIVRDLAGWAQHIEHVEPQEVFDELKQIWKAGLEKKPKIRKKAS